MTITKDANGNETYHDPFDRKSPIMFIVMSENYAGKGFPDAGFYSEEQAEDYKKQRESEQIHRAESFMRYFSIHRVVINPKHESP